jgi:hypothetical protein
VRASINLALLVAALLLPATMSSQEPTSPTKERGRSVNKQAAVTADPARPYRPIPVGPSRPQETIFEFYFKALNPRKIHWGDEIDKRIEQFVDHSIRNPYFRFCAVQMGVILMLLALCWAWWDRLRQTKWITAEWLADAINAKQMSDRRAMDAIAAYNRHMESCNRVVEEQTSGIGKAIGYGPKFEMEKLQNDLAASRAEVERLNAQIQDRDAKLARQEARIQAVETKVAQAHDSSKAELIARLERAEAQLNNQAPRRATK